MIDWSSWFAPIPDSRSSTCGKRSNTRHHQWLATAAIAQCSCQDNQHGHVRLHDPRSSGVTEWQHNRTLFACNGHISHTHLITQQRVLPDERVVTGAAQHAQHHKQHVLADGVAQVVRAVHGKEVRGQEPHRAAAANQMQATM